MNCNNKTCLPPCSEWPEAISKNKKQNALSSPELRRKLIKSALEFTEELNTLSAERLKRDIFIKDGSYSEDEIILSGHQPEIYHHGILFKNFLLNQYSKEKKVTGINLIIDTDEGLAGTVVYPVVTDGIPGKKKAAFNTELRPYIFQNIPAKEKVRGLFDEIQSAVDVSEYRQYYEAMEGRPVVEAHTIIRRIFEKSPSYLEVPLSAILSFSEVKDFFLRIIKDAQNFAASYNSTLQQFRTDEKIKNKANPFPDLEVSAGSIELPFWILDKSLQTRAPLIVRDSSAAIVNYNNISIPLAEIAENFMIVPKAALITLFSRLLLGDAFIHGLGGAKYDRFTDRLIKNYFKLPAPQFFVASADVYYYSQQVEQYEKDKFAAEERRKMGFHVEKYLEQLNCSADVKGRLVQLSKDKMENIEKIKAGKIARQSTAEFTQIIKRIESEMKSILLDVLGPEPEFHEPSKIYLDTIYSRDFSYFTARCNTK